MFSCTSHCLSKFISAKKLQGWPILRSLVAIIYASVLVGCAKSSNEVASSYVSPTQYQHMSCSQINGELVRVSSRVSELGGRLDEAASNDAAITGVGLIVFWPALFALGGTSGQEAEYSRLKGEYEALNQLAIQGNCMSMTPGFIPRTSGDFKVDTSKASKLEEASRLCRAQGIPDKTEGFGKCVLNLSK